MTTKDDMKQRFIEIRLNGEMVDAYTIKFLRVSRFSPTLVLRRET